MKTDFLKRNWQIILLNIIITLCFILGYGRFGDVIVDSFREAYVPEQMLCGQALYKNIFIVYPPLAYFINACLFYVFGVKLKVLYCAGFLAALGILNLTFKISKKFLPKDYSFSIVLFIIFTASLSGNVFNLFFPYSFGLTYGLLFMLSSLYFMLKGKYTAGYFLYSLAVCSKYEFLFVLPVFVWISQRKDILKNIFVFLLPVISVLGVLYFQGVRPAHLLITFDWINLMTSSKTLYWFYSVSGLIFRPQLIPIYFINFIKIFAPLIIIYKYRNFCTILLTFTYLWFFANPEIFIYIFPLILLLTALEFRNLNKKKKFFILASFFVSIKLFFALTLKSYGIYFLPFALISIFILVPKKLKKAFSIILICAAIVFGIKNSIDLCKKNIKIQTQKGVVYANLYNGESLNKLISFIDKNTSENDKILVLPEGTLINFLTDRNTDNKIYSLIPLYVETFGENIIIDRLEFIKPKYIAITNYDTSNYYYSYFGYDYGKRVYSYILDKYEPDVQFIEGLKINLYKRKY